MKILSLFLSYLQIGLFSFGGGMAALPLIQSQVVEKHQWLSLSEFTDLVTIAEMTPGPIAINSATFVGKRIAGIGGAVVATIGCILPACIIVFLLAFLYFKFKSLKAMDGILSGLRPAVVAMIASAGMAILKMAVFDGVFSIHSFSLFSALLVIASVFILRKWTVNPIFVMLGCGVIGGIFYSLPIDFI